MNRSALLTPSAVLTLLSCATITHSQVSLFTNRVSFENATSKLTTIDFNDQIAPGTTERYYDNGTTTISGVTFTSNRNRLFTVPPSYYYEYNLGDGPVLHWEGTWPRILTIDLPPDTTAVGMDFGAELVTPFDFTLSTGDTFTLTGSKAPTSTPTFAGFTSVLPISTLSVTVTQHVIITEIDRFTFGSVASTPEPGPFALLIGLGLSGAGFLARRRKNARQAT